MMSHFRLAFQLFRRHRLFWNFAAALAVIHSLIAAVAVLAPPLLDIPAARVNLIIGGMYILPLIVYCLAAYAACPAWNGQPPELRAALEVFATRRAGALQMFGYGLMAWAAVLVLVVLLSGMWYVTSGAIDAATFDTLYHLLLFAIALPVSLILQFTLRAILIDEQRGLQALHRGIKVASRCRVSALAASILCLGVKYAIQGGIMLLVLAARGPAELRAFTSLGITEQIFTVMISPAAQIAAIITEPVFVPFYAILMSVFYLRLTRTAPAETPVEDSDESTLLVME